MSTGVSIIGAAETERIGRLPDQSVLGLNVEAGARAMRDAGVTRDQIDGIAGAY